MAAWQQIAQRLTDNIYPTENKVVDLLQGKRKLRVYLGIDPTSPNVHLGHTIPLRLLRSFQEAGHKIILLIGDFTAKIGDPSGRDIQRKVLSDQQVADNVKTYKSQVEKILDFKTNPPEIAYNATWWGAIDSSKLFEILSSFTLAQLSERDLFQERIKKNQPISISEFLYPVIQGYDSVKLNADIEIGGSDQTFNMLIGRELVKKYLGKEKTVLTTPLIEGLDGRKMSKSFDNAIDILTEPADMFGKIMAVNDDLIVKYFKFLTNIPTEKLEEISTLLRAKKVNPMELKKDLAFEIVGGSWGEVEAQKARKEFERVFQKGEAPKTVDLILSSQKRRLIDIIAKSGFVQSNSEAKRIIEQGGVLVKKVKQTDPQKEITPIEGDIIQVGKFKALKIKIK